MLIIKFQFALYSVSVLGREEGYKSLFGNDLMENIAQLSKSLNSVKILVIDNGFIMNTEHRNN